MERKCSNCRWCWKDDGDADEILPPICLESPGTPISIGRRYGRPCGRHDFVDAEATLVMRSAELPKPDAPGEWCAQLLRDVALVRESMLHWVDLLLEDQPEATAASCPLCQVYNQTEVDGSCCTGCPIAGYGYARCARTPYRHRPTKDDCVAELRFLRDVGRWLERQLNVGEDV